MNCLIVSHRNQVVNRREPKYPGGFRKKSVNLVFTKRCKYGTFCYALGLGTERLTGTLWGAFFVSLGTLADKILAGPANSPGALKCSGGFLIPSYFDRRLISPIEQFREAANAAPLKTYAASPN